MNVLVYVVIFMLLLSVAAMVVLLRLYGKCSALERENSMLDAQNMQLVDRLSKKDNEAATLQASREELFERVALLEGENGALLQRLEGQKAQFEKNLEQMRLEFKTMATEALQRNSELFEKESQERLANILRPFNSDLKQFREKVENYYGEENRQRFSLQESIKTLVEANQRISRDAVNLTNAIAGTSNNKFQGDWGETILEQILENSGLVEGEQL